jgi:hypothetical protein
VPTRQIAVINQSEELTADDVARAAAAVQKQVVNDFGPLWGVTATVSVFPSLEIPPDYWPVVIRDDIGINEPGVHSTEFPEKPFALVLFTGSKWTVTLSHEILELLLDPSGTLLISGPSVRPDEGTVEYLAEICDPCQSNACAYLVNGDQWMSDFVTPAFYKGFGPGRYSFAGNVLQPRQVMPFGYMTWHDPVHDAWWQVLDRGNGPQFRPLDPSVLRPNVHLRGAIDRDTEAVLRHWHKPARPRRLSAAEKALQQRAERHAAVARAQAAWWQRQIEQVSGRSSRAGGPSDRPKRGRGKSRS